MVMKMKTKSKICTVALIIIVFILSLTACSDSNGGIISNYNFENGSGTSIKNWKKYDYHKDYEKDSSRTKISLVDMGFDGQCVKIESSGKNDARDRKSVV